MIPMWRNIILGCTLVLLSCKKDKAELDQVIQFQPTPYALQVPTGFPPLDVPAYNQLTVEGVALGRHLFYDKRLSGNNTQACADCHFPHKAFGDSNQFSTGISGAMGNRQAMVLQNLGYANSFFWDGREHTLEEQALRPVTNPIEMNASWTDVEAKLQADTMYQRMFYEAFGITNIDSIHVAYAIAQFERTLITGNSRFDKWSRGEILLTADEFAGFDLFRSLTGGDCFHCHAHSSRLFTDHSFSNNGLDAVLVDNGQGDITGDPNDNGKFKVPTLRNVEFSGPYMHDGRFQTLEEVIDFYSDQVEHSSPNISPLMEFSSTGGVALTPSEKLQILAFLKSLTDTEFLSNPEFANPFE